MVAPYISKSFEAEPRTFIQADYLFQMLNTRGTTAFSCRNSGGFEVVRVNNADSGTLEARLKKHCTWPIVKCEEATCTYFAFQTETTRPAAHFVARPALPSTRAGLVGKVELATSRNSAGALVGDLQLNVEPADVAFALGVAHGAKMKKLELFRC
jgi:hypothetical protein